MDLNDKFKKMTIDKSSAQSHLEQVQKIEGEEFRKADRESESDDDWEDSEPIAAPKQVDSFDESNALEIWNFPSTYTKKEIEALFGLNVDVKWVNDTSAVIHFDTPQDLKRGYLQLSGHSTIKYRIYTPIEKRDRSSRPTTTDMVARRMIAGALGMNAKLKKTAAEIESDSLKLRLVREEKENAIKRKADEKDQRVKASNELFDS